MSPCKAELTSKRNAYVGWAVAEGAVSVAGLVAAGIGGLGLSRGGDAHRTRDASLAGGGLLLTGLAGSLMLYHVLRALDVSTGRPVWHHLDQETARRLAARAR